ncbi:MAG: type II toxin-antitoxin system VapC family toxin [bacterium]|nr:type II toxin-antitoxin system VapC family toxin [bacterium]
MSGYLVDTNVVSELLAPDPNANVIAFLNDQHSLWFSAVVVHELEFGFQQLPSGYRRSRLHSVLMAFVDSFADKILPVGRREAEQAAAVRGQARQQGRTVHLADGLIMGTALVHGLDVATRNVRDFADNGIGIVNPWAPL